MRHELKLSLMLAVAACGGPLFSRTDTTSQDGARLPAAGVTPIASARRSAA